MGDLTANYGLYKPATKELDTLYCPLLNANMDLIDAQLHINSAQYSTVTVLIPDPDKFIIDESAGLVLSNEGNILISN